MDQAMGGPQAGEYEAPWDPKEQLGEAEEAVAEETGVPVDDPEEAAEEAVAADEQPEPSSAEPPG